MEDSGSIVINEDYEFLGPKLFDYKEGETEDHMNEVSVHRAPSHATSNFMPKINTTRTTQLESLCDFSEAENSQKEPEPSKSTGSLHPTKNIHLEPKSKRDTGLTNSVEVTNFGQENEAIKKQKLEGGKTRRISRTETHNLPHKARAGVVMQRRSKMTLTRPKEPEFETSRRVRSRKVRSSIELEEEMMAKIPKFEARKFNRKIFEAPTSPTMKRSTCQITQIQEFYLETTARANQNAETSKVVLIETSPQNHQWKPRLTTPKTPLLHTSFRARPPKIKSSQELGIEELEKAPKFKAKPLNKKILESKGELGLFCNTKRQVTIPQEFHFATDERIPPPKTANVAADLFDKIASCLESHKNRVPTNRAPRPFHLQTEERGATKESKFLIEVIHKQLKEEQARIRKANPCPCTTDYPVVPPKPEPKRCTRPEPFQLESLVRHEEETQREMEERRRFEEEEASMRMFKAQPVLKEDPIPVPERVRKPLTQVQEFDLHVERRAKDRAEFDKNVKEKEIMSKKCQDEAETAKMMDEENALKELRKTLVTHARQMPSFDRPFLPQKSSKGVTKPKSPRLKVLERIERRRTMFVASATSTSASNMR